MKTYEELQTENNRLVAERDSLAALNNTLLECLSDIQCQCVGQIVMGYKLDPELIGRSIYEATGLTEPELRAKVRKGADALSARTDRAIELLSDVRRCEEFIVDHSIMLGVDSDLADQIDEIISSTPQQCLAEIRAEAGRAGFIAGIDSLEVAQILGSDFDAEKSADEYAAAVRKGVE